MNKYQKAEAAKRAAKLAAKKAEAKRIKGEEYLNSEEVQSFIRDKDSITWEDLVNGTEQAKDLLARIRKIDRTLDAL